MKTYLPNYLKEKNRKLVFDLFRRKRELTRKEMSDELEMSFPTTVKSVNRLLELGIVTELEEPQPSIGAGRRSRMLQFCPESFLAVGVTFEGRYANAGLIDLDGNVLCKKSIVLAALSPETDLHEVADAVRQIIAQVDSDKLLGIGIGFPAIVNPNTSEIVHLNSMNIQKPVLFMEQFPLFRTVGDYPMYLDNDVNIACVGEAFLRGKSQVCRDLVYLSLGTGCGSAILMDGCLWRGNHFKSGEVGSFLSSTEKPRENPGANFENTVNLNAISKKFHIDFEQNFCPSPEMCHKICAYLVPYLNLLLHDLSCVLDIDLYVLSGVIPKMLGDELFQMVLQQLDSMPCAGQRLKVELSISDNAGIVGAAMQVFDHRIEELLGE